MANDDITPAILLEHMQAMKHELSTQISGLSCGMSSVKKGLSSLSREVAEFRKENKAEHEAMHEDLAAIGEDIYQQKHKINPHVELRLARLEEIEELPPLPVPIAVE